MSEDPSRLLYHGTLLRNPPSIRAHGLRPQKGSWIARFHANAEAHVFAVDNEHKSAAILAIAGQMIKAGLVRVTQNYLLDEFKNDLIEHGAVLVVKAATFRHYPPIFIVAGHPPGTEPGNWYSSEPVRIERELIGQEMLSWLSPTESNFMHQYRDALREASEE